jgi:hypothetical protein
VSKITNKVIDAHSQFMLHYSSCFAICLYVVQANGKEVCPVSLDTRQTSYAFYEVKCEQSYNNGDKTMTKNKTNHICPPPPHVFRVVKTLFLLLIALSLTLSFTSCGGGGGTLTLTGLSAYNGQYFYAGTVSM